MLHYLCRMKAFSQQGWSMGILKGRHIHSGNLNFASPVLSISPASAMRRKTV